MRAQPSEGPVNQIESQKRRGALNRDALKHMAVDVMAELVRQHRLHFLILKLCEQRIRQDDPARIAESHQGGVGLLALLAEFPFEHALHACARAPREFQQALRQRGILERLELEEDREN